MGSHMDSTASAEEGTEILFILCPDMEVVYLMLPAQLEGGCLHYHSLLMSAMTQ